jgi:hypothetical protein
MQGIRHVTLYRYRTSRIPTTLIRLRLRPAGPMIEIMRST